MNKEQTEKYKALLKAGRVMSNNLGQKDTGWSHYDYEITRKKIKRMQENWDKALSEWRAEQ
jgi:hypothetical protein